MSKITFLKIKNQLDSFNNFKDLNNYVKENLHIINSGSSRTIVLTDYNTVIKIAKNIKGVEQNHTESNKNIKSEFINKTISNSDRYIWVESEYLENINEEQFQKYTGFSFYNFSKAIDYALNIVSDSHHEKPRDLEKVKNSDIYKDIVSVGKLFNIMPGDMIRISSYRQKDKKPILVDFGLTKDIYYKYYD